MVGEGMTKGFVLMFKVPIALLSRSSRAKMFKVSYQIKLQMGRLEIKSIKSRATTETPLPMASFEHVLLYTFNGKMNKHVAFQVVRT